MDLSEGKEGGRGAGRAAFARWAEAASEEGKSSALLGLVLGRGGAPRGPVSASWATRPRQVANLFLLSFFSFYSKAIFTSFQNILN